MSHAGEPATSSNTASRAQRTIVGRGAVGRWIGRIFGCAALLVVTAWLIGRAFTDQWAWTQWLFWIPTPCTIIACGVGWIAARGSAFRAGRTTARLWAWRIVTPALLVYFVAFEHRFLHAAASVPASGVLKVTHWNMGPRLWVDQPQFFDALKPIAGDLTIITNPGGTFGEPYAQQWIEARGLTVRSFGVFAAISSQPIESLHLLVGTDGQWVYLLRIDATEAIGRKLNIYVIDLPSSGRRSRMLMAHRVRGMLDDLPARFGRTLPEPDLVVGDFNIPRGSASLEVLFPNLREAYVQAGHGYGASFHRLFPLYHIDHIRLGPSVHALRYDLINAGIGRHDAQTAWIVPATN